MRRRRILVGTAAGVAVVLVGGGLALAATNNPSGSYRTATVQDETVKQTVSLSGTVASTTRRDLAFGVRGTVSSVAVTPGQQVHAGDTLATLDLTSLNSALQSAQQNASVSSQTLADDLASQTATTSTASSAPSSSGSSGTGSTTSGTPGSGSTGTGASGSGGSVTGGSGSGVSGTGGSGAGSSHSTGTGSPTTSPAVSGDVAHIKAAQQSLLAANAKATADLTASQNAAAAEGTACDVVKNDSLSSGSAPTPTPTPTATPAPTPTPSATPSPSSGSSLSTVQSDLAACQAAIAAVQTAQQTTATAQQLVQTDATALDTVVAQLQSDLGKATTSTGTGSTTGGSTTGASTSGASTTGASTGSGAGTTGGGSTRTSASASSGSGATGGSSGGGSAGGSATTPASADTLIADQAAVTAANAAVTVAQRNVSLATLTTPIDGVVAAVNLATGSSVSAGSTSQVITIIGPSGWSVRATVPVTRIGSLKVGQSASVTVAGTAATLTGSVSSIGITNVSSDASNPAYSVTVGLTDSAAHLLNGAPAQATVAVSSAANVLAVPTSAVHRVGTTSVVYTMHGGTPTATRVTVGTAGTDFTQITSGLSRGDVVELADLSAPLPTTTTGFGAGGAGRFARQVTGGGGAGGAGAGTGKAFTRGAGG